ncbi:MAG: hypothetical protein ABH887_00280 [bacterium]
MNSNNLEDFKIELIEPISDDELNQLVVDYFKSRNYIFDQEASRCGLGSLFFKKKREKSVYVTLSCYCDCLIVSVSELLF